MTGDDTNGNPSLSSFDRMFEAGGDLFASSNGRGLFRSTDGGRSWQAANEGIPLQGSGSPADLGGVVKLGASLFAIGTRVDSSSIQSVLFRSTDDGASWTDLSSALPATLLAERIATDGKQLFTVFVRSPIERDEGIFSSRDGTRWTRVAGEPGVHDLQSIVVTSDRVLLGTDGQGVLSAPLTECSL